MVSMMTTMTMVAMMTMVTMMTMMAMVSMMAMTVSVVVKESSPENAPRWQVPERGHGCFWRP